MAENYIVHGKVDEFVQWYDEDGDIINASDGGILYEDGVYHWYGMALRALPDGRGGASGGASTEGIVMYASTDLHHWKKEGVILALSDDPTSPLYAPMRVERPKILKCPNTGKYVLWCHYTAYPGDQSDLPGKSEAGIAVSDKINGPYTFLGCTRPIDDRGIVKDSTLYQDKDGSAYFIYDRKYTMEDCCLHVVKLSDDYLSCTDTWVKVEPAMRREAAAILYHDGYYFMVTSGRTGWEFNQAKYFRATSMLGPWEDMGDPCVGDEDHKTFHSQSTYAFHLAGQPDKWIVMLERHNTQNFLHCSYIWLPVTFHEDHTISLHYQEKWAL